MIEGDYETLSEISSDEDELIRNGVDQTYDYYWNPNEGHSALQTILVDASFEEMETYRPRKIKPYVRQKQITMNRSKIILKTHSIWTHGTTATISY